MVGGVLVERTVKEVLPALEGNKEQVSEGLNRECEGRKSRQKFMVKIVCGLLVCALYTVTKSNSLRGELLAACPFHRLFDVVDLGGEWVEQCFSQCSPWIPESKSPEELV
ncbi:hypothetical protein LEMLEM_LOCUS24415 [Lemmus lemmus]